MTTLWLKWLVAFSALLSVTVQAHAQPLFGYAESIETTVANADLVFVAKIVNLGDEVLTDGNSACEATLAIEQTLKIRLGLNQA